MSDYNLHTTNLPQKTRPSMPAHFSQGYFILTRTGLSTAPVLVGMLNEAGQIRTGENEIARPVS